MISSPPSSDALRLPPRAAGKLLALLLLCASPGTAKDRCDPPVVIPGVKGDTTTRKFGSGYITRSSDGTVYTTSKFGNGWITRSSDGKSYTTTKFGDGAITRGGGQQVTTSRFGTGTISRSSDGTTTTTRRFGSGSTGSGRDGSGYTTSKFGNGWITRETSKGKDGGSTRIIPAPKPAKKSD